MLRLLMLPFIFSLMLSACGRPGEKNESTAHARGARSYSTPFPQIIAHRGFSKVAPENTFASFRAAIAVEADTVELDYYHSKDNVPVVIHDDLLDRTTDIKSVFGRENVKVSSLTYSELESLDAGSWFGLKFKNEKIRSLEESMDFITGHDATVLVEQKEGDPKTFVNLYEASSRKDQIMLQSFDWKFLHGVNELNRNVTLVALGKDNIDETLIQSLKGDGIQILSWRKDLLTREAIELAHNEELKVYAYTVNDLDEARALDDLGVDGLITDAPVLMKQKLRN